MTKPKSPRKTATRSPSRKTAEGASHKRPSTTSSKPKPGSDTKHARIIAMLRTTAGTTIPAIVKATDWQQHSVRGFLAGVVRKMLSLNLVSELTNKGRVYRIKDSNVAFSSTSRTKQTA
jgi:hypothetical protein